MFELKAQKLHFLLLLVLVVVGIFSCSVESLRFDLQSDLARCIAQDIKKNSLTVGNYSIINPNEGQPLPESHKIIVKVVMQGNTVHLAEHVESGQFAFMAQYSGDYVACFWGPEKINPPINLTIDFEWKTGVAAKDWPNIAKKRHIEQTGLELLIMQETLKSIQEEMTYLRESEEEILELNMITSHRMLWMSLGSLFICFSVAGLQFWHLKTFFVKNKLI